MATVGSTAPSQNTVNYNALLSTTLFNYKRVLFDNIFKNSAFLAALREYGGVEMVNGGERIACPLMYETSTTAKSFSGYDVIDTTPQDGLTTAFYEWRELAATIAISRREERQNSGEAQIINLLKAKTQQAEMSLKQAVNTQLVQGTVSGATFVPGNSVKDMNPLGWFCRKAPATDPTVGGNVGNIAGATYTWWRPAIYAMDTGTTPTGCVGALNVSTYAGVKRGLKSAWNFASRGADGSGPNVVLMNQASYEIYESALDVNTRYMDTKLADMGFDTLKLKGATVLWDEVVPDIDNGTAAITAGTAFFLNTKFYKLAIDSQTDFTTTPFVESQDQAAQVAKVLFMGNATCTNLRKIGAAYGILQTIAS